MFVVVVIFHLSRDVVHNLPCDERELCYELTELRTNSLVNFNLTLFISLGWQTSELLTYKVRDYRSL